MAPDPQKGMRIVICCTLINLCNILFAWSVVKGEIAKKIQAGDPAWDWDVNHLNLPYSVATMVFASSIWPGGYCYDKFGPRVMTTIGGMMIMLGLVVCSLSTSLAVWVFGFGLCTASGLGACYCAQTPTALKWWPPTKVGLVVGIVVGGFGMAPVYLSPLASSLIRQFGIRMTMRLLGALFGAVIVPLAQLLENPPVVALPQPAASGAAGQKTKASSLVGAPAPASENFTLGEALGTRALWLCMLLNGVGGGVGVMMIGEGAGMAAQALPDSAKTAVVLLSIGNCAGGVVAGVMSDLIGLRLSLLFFFAAQAATMWGLLLVPKDSAACILLAATSLGFNYGANPSLWSVAAKVYFGTRHFGKIFGFIFVGWGVGSFCFSHAFQVMKEDTGSMDGGCIMGLSVLLVGIVLISLLRPPVRAPARDMVELGGRAVPWAWSA